MQLIVSLLLLAGLTPTFALPSSSNRTSWTALPNIGLGPRQEHSVVALNGKIYILGGIIPNSNASIDSTTNFMESYSISSQKWTTEVPIPKALNHLNAAVVRGKIYILGGLQVGPGPTWPLWNATGESWVYTPETKSWRSIPAMPVGTERGSCAVGVKGDIIYLTGGLRYLGITGQRNLNTTTAYDTKTRTWTILPELPKRMDHASGMVVRDAFYVVGGRTNGLPSGNVATVYAMDLKSATPSWVLKGGVMPTPRGGLAVAAVRDVIYAFGGENNVNATSGVFPQVEAYDAEKDTWSSLEEMKIPRHGTGAVGVEGKIYIPGGGVVQSLGGTDYFDVFKP